MSLLDGEKVNGWVDMAFNWLEEIEGLGFRVGGRQHERSEGWMREGWLRGVEAESTEGGCVPSSLSFDLICLIRTPIQTEIQT